MGKRSGTRPRALQCMSLGSVGIHAAESHLKTGAIADIGIGMKRLALRFEGNVHGSTDVPQ
jgi:hypothetical protein